MFKTLFSLKYFYLFAFVLSIIGIFTFIYDYGFNQTSFIQSFLNQFYFLVLLLGVIASIFRYIIDRKKWHWFVFTFDLMSVLLAIAVVYLHYFHVGSIHISIFFFDDNIVKFAVILTFIREYSDRDIKFNRSFLNPAQLFVVSFIGIIVLGGLLLMLPNATTQPIAFVDALFTSTSAVCVTGLTVVDTGTFYTPLGQGIILVLIQIGGLGILTFASYFSYLFRGESNFENQLMLSDMTNSDKIGKVFTALKEIIVITFIIELIGAILIFISVGFKTEHLSFDTIFFSIFHSVSAFCNAGFSTLSNNLYEPAFQFNYSLHLIIAFLLIFGGLGFSIVSNVVSYTKHLIFNKLIYLKRIKRLHKPWVLSLNSRITLITTAFLLLIGTLLIFFTEYNNTLKMHSILGKIIEAFFASATPRTAGFNTIDMTLLETSTILITIFLMWIGASPASTGGGIKTNTFAIAIMNVISLSKGKTRIELFRREVSHMSVRRAMAAIFLSILVISMGVLALTILNPDIYILSLVFETVSAFSTVGLSLGITFKLTTMSKYILILIMFVGRVSMLSMLIAVIRKTKYKNYRYPSEEIIIN
jgi:potassium uptake TrkH family protein